jgi:hypothetical protein
MNKQQEVFGEQYDPRDSTNGSASVVPFCFRSRATLQYLRTLHVSRSAPSANSLGANSKISLF